MTGSPEGRPKALGLVLGDEEGEEWPGLLFMERYGGYA